MTDYVISGVQYDLDRARIQRVRLRPSDSRDTGPPVELTREEFLLAVQVGGRFVRARGPRSGEPLEKAPVRVVRLGASFYLRCDSYPWPLDDLAGIPEY